MENRELDAKEISVGQRVRLLGDDHDPTTGIVGVVRSIDQDGDLIIDIGGGHPMMLVPLIDVELA